MSADSRPLSDILVDLLDHVESDWLDWKGEFPGSLLAGANSSAWDNGRAELLKDLIAIANSDGNSESIGYLVYGVIDHKTHREVVGTKKSWDDAEFQQWAENVFDPMPMFQYGEVEAGPGTRVGIFVIQRVPEYPHVVKRSLGKMLAKGQVWFRRNSKNTEALRPDLERMIMGEAPMKFASGNDPRLATMLKSLHTAEEEPAMVSQGEVDSRLLSGYRFAYWPETRRKILIGAVYGHEGSYLMVRKRVR